MAVPALKKPAVPARSVPRATYRLQFHREFTFDNATEIAPYLARLGISHVYASPILAARPGSRHGYDVINYARINPELGGERSFRRFCGKCAESGLKLIVDIVPNHMAAGAGNAWWQDVLERGRASPYAGYFDIDWYAFDGKVLAPFLGAPYAEELASGRISLMCDDRSGQWSIAYYEHRFPLRPEDQRDVARGAFSNTDDLHRLLLRQHYRLCWWRTAADAINWRRFFNITDLIALRIEKPDVFDAVHEKIFALVADGLIDGVRVDHVDGLADPAGYCRKLRHRLDALRRNASRPYLVVEKILGRDEQLPEQWAVDGTTGYDFLDEASALLHDARAEQQLAQVWHTISGRPADFESEERAARETILVASFHAPLAATAGAFAAAAAATLFAPDITHAALVRALIHLIANLRRYRSYSTGLEPFGDADFQAAIDAAQRELRGTDAHALAFIARAIAGQLPAKPALIADAVRRFNQLAASVAAKAVEDTGFYRYGRLLSRNDVGCTPQRFAIAPAAFHDRNAARAARFPHAMLATATHDHKRGEDARARLAVLSEITDDWSAKVHAWFACNAPLRPQQVERGDEYQLYQTLAGAWPPDLVPDDGPGLAALSERIAGWRIKSLREAKLKTSWRDPDEKFETANLDFLRAILDPAVSPGFLSSLHAFVARIGPAGALNGLAQCALRFTCPGVPDTFQGTEFWDFSLVDPDNRRPVDFRARIDALEENSAEVHPSFIASNLSWPAKAGHPGGTSPVLPGWPGPRNSGPGHDSTGEKMLPRIVLTKLPELLHRWQDGRVKQAMIARLAALREQLCDVFTRSSYEPLDTVGPRSANVVAFLRRAVGTSVLVAVPRLCAGACIAARKPLPAASFWMDSAIALPANAAAATWISVFDGTATRSDGGLLSCEHLFAQFPIVVLQERVGR